MMGVLSLKLINQCIHSANTTVNLYVADTLLGIVVNETDRVSHGQGKFISNQLELTFIILSAPNISLQRGIDSCSFGSQVLKFQGKHWPSLGWVPTPTPTPAQSKLMVFPYLHKPFPYCLSQFKFGLYHLQLRESQSIDK